MLKRLLDSLAETIIDYLKMQIKNGADVIMLFDSWGGLLSPANLPNFSLCYMDKIVNNLNEEFPSLPTIVFVKGGGHSLESIAKIQCSGIGIDWTVNLAHAKRLFGKNRAIQGNLDPAVLLGEEKFIRSEVYNLMASLTRDEQKNGYIFNLGHGISQYTSPKNVEILLNAIKEY